MARNVKCASFVVMVLSRAPHATGEKSTAVKSTKASPLAFSSIASQPRNFSYSPKMARNAKCAYFVAMELGRAWRAAGERKQQVLSARASTLAVSPIADQPRRFSDSRKIAKNAKCAFCVAMALGRARQAAREILIGKSGLPELALVLSA